MTLLPHRRPASKPDEVSRQTSQDARKEDEPRAKFAALTESTAHHQKENCRHGETELPGEYRKPKNRICNRTR